MYYNINFSRNYPRVISYNFGIKEDSEAYMQAAKDNAKLWIDMANNDQRRLMVNQGPDDPNFSFKLLTYFQPGGPFESRRAVGLLAGGGAGALGGMGAGALLGNYLTKNPMNKKRNMLIGGGLGTLGGGILGGIIGRGIGNKAAVQGFVDVLKTDM